MRMLIRLFVAFCVATVLAQGIIITLAGLRGNLKSDTLVRAIALLNGIDITGDQLKKMLDDSREQPNITLEDIIEERARENSILDMRERSISAMKQQTEEMLAELQTKVADFDLRKDEFHTLLKRTETDLLEESLKEVQRTIESLTPEQAKDQLLRMYDAGQKDDVVAIVKGMPLDKRKKILGEFANEKEAAQLHEILMRLRLGEPTAGLIQDARDQPSG